MKKLSILLLAGCVGVMALTGCGGMNGEATRKGGAAGEREEIYVFIAASLANAMEEIADNYKEKEPDLTIHYNADSSQTLQTQIEEGAECDVFLSAAAEQMEALTEQELVDKASVKKLLGNKVVLIKPAGQETGVTGFETITRASNIALAGKDVPVGQYSREIFTNMGILDQVNVMEINEGKNVTEVLAAVCEASNEIGVVYATDAVSAGRAVEIIAEASKEYLETPVVYPVGLVENPQADSTQRQLAMDFVEYLSQEASLEVFEKYGFTVGL